VVLDTAVGCLNAAVLSQYPPRVVDGFFAGVTRPLINVIALRCVSHSGATVALSTTKPCAWAEEPRYQHLCF
jgi:hypothetical protein